MSDSDEPYFWGDEDPGRCAECDEPYELVRPGKSQPTCDCHLKCPTCGLMREYVSTGRHQGHFCLDCDLDEQSMPKELLLRRKLFDLTGKWLLVNLAERAVWDFRDRDKPNPLLDPAQCQKWVEGIHAHCGVDFSYGGYLEDRSWLWRGHYHQPDAMIHLGVDYNVPAGTRVYCPAEAEVVLSEHDPDQNGGWGGRVILRSRADRYLILGHLANRDLPAVGSTLRAGDYIGLVGEPHENGGWYPHLHAQSLRDFDPEADGYAKGEPDMAVKYPAPSWWLASPTVADATWKT